MLAGKYILKVDNGNNNIPFYAAGLFLYPHTSK